MFSLALAYIRAVLQKATKIVTKSKKKETSATTTNRIKLQKAIKNMNARNDMVFKHSTRRFSV